LLNNLANILSALCNKPFTISAGASGMIFGILGAYVAYMTINWSALAPYAAVRSQICCLIGFIVFFSILFSFGSGIDLFGHIGGMIGGYMISLAILPGL
jgi:rhomboid protease GluP